MSSSIRRRRPAEREGSRRARHPRYNVGMATVHVEFEATYDAAGEFEVPSLVELFGRVRGKAGVPPADGTPWAESEAAEQDLHATYFDTSELDLTAADLSLRRRTGGDDEGWHLKVAVADSRRAEIGLPLGDEDGVPETLLAMTYARTLGRPLVAVAQIDTHRTVRRLVDPTGRVLAEIVDDRVVAERIRPAAETAHSPHRTSWREVQVEIVDGPTELLAAVDPILRDRGLIPAPPGSKLVRVLGSEEVQRARRASDPAAAARITSAQGGGAAKKGSAGDVALVQLRAQVAQIRAQDLPVRLDLSGAVHAMRVASRRLRSALTTFRPLFHGTATRPVGRELKWLAGVLGTARDAEVLRDRLTAAASDEAPDARLNASIGAEVHEQLDVAYRAARDEVLTQLDGERYRTLLRTLDVLLRSPPVKNRAGRPARRALPR